MKIKNECKRHGLILLCLLILMIINLPLLSQDTEEDDSYAKIGEKVQRLMKEGDIPGLSLIIVKGSETVFMKGFGYADVENKVPVSPDTVFELGSCSKAFTALAALQCEEKELLNLDAPVSKYLPWFSALYEGKKTEITLRQCLHHTSGIPFRSISLIPESNAEDALQQTVKKLQGIELDHAPGTKFEYATINYDIIGALIEEVSGKSYEDYINRNILVPLGLTDTIVGVDKENPPENMASGYKVGFFSPHKYDAPVFRGNTPAGYILSNAKDMAQWLRIQMGLVETELTHLIRESHQVEETAPFNRATLSHYTMGWNVYMAQMKLIDHGGDNPNFTSFILFNPQDKIGIAVLANCRSTLTPFIAKTVMSYVSGNGFLETAGQGDGFDKGASVVSFMVGFFILVVIVFLISILVGIIRGKRKFAPLSLKKTGMLLLALLAYVPFLFGLYLIPMTLAGVSMDTAIVFSPWSFTIVLLLVLSAMALCYIGMVFSALFPQKNKYLRSIPFVLVLSFLAGGANAVVIFLITTSVFSQSDLVYQLYNFALAFFVYIIGRKVLQTKLTRITFDIVYDMRMNLLEKVFYTSYQKYEKLDRGRVFATLNNDTGQIGGSANILVALVTSAVTSLGAFLYLATIAFWATAITIIVVVAIGALYSFVTKRTRVYFEEARDTQNVYMRLLNGMNAGFKELTLQYNKRKQYKTEIAETCDEFRKKSSTALIKFINAFLIGESLLIVVLGSVGFGIPRLFPNIKAVTLMAFIMVLLYLIGPINALLNSIPAIMRLKVAWDRVRGFIKDIPANIDPKEIDALNHDNPGTVETIEAKGLVYSYQAPDGGDSFSVGPINFDARKGEIVFIIGGNGSGKTTLAKLLTGLYLPEKGSIKVDGKEINNYQLGEYYSTVFGDYHLFEKLYNIDLSGKEEEIQAYLKMLRLDKKVKLEGNSFSTINLSGGQRKRLALLQCYLEDRPIYLFDEIAADQDPAFRKFFYRELLQRMREKGKIVIAITHDDHYFDVADRVVKMDMGNIEQVEDGARLTVTKQKRGIEVLT